MNIVDKAIAFDERRNPLNVTVTLPSGREAHFLPFKDKGALVEHRNTFHGGNVSEIKRLSKEIQKATNVMEKIEKLVNEFDNLIITSSKMNFNKATHNFKDLKEDEDRNFYLMLIIENFGGKMFKKETIESNNNELFICYEYDFEKSMWKLEYAQKDKNEELTNWKNLKTYKELKQLLAIYNQLI